MAAGAAQSDTVLAAPLIHRIANPDSISEFDILILILEKEKAYGGPLSPMCMKPSLGQLKTLDD